MKLGINFFFIIWVGALLQGCNQAPGFLEERGDSAIPVLDFESAMTRNVPDTFVWNSIVRRVEFIPLQSNNDSLLLSGSININYWDGNCFFITDAGTSACYRYGLDGKVQLQIKKTGQGPGEYAILSYLYASPERHVIEVFDEGNGKCIRYDWDGKLIEEKQLKDIVIPKFMSEQYSVFLGMPNTEYQVAVGDTSLQIHNRYVYLGKEYDPIKRSAIQLLTARCQNKDMFLLYRPMCDTIYQVTDTLLLPQAILKRGKYDLQETDLGRFMTGAVKTMDVLMWPIISSVSDYCLLDYTWKQERRSEIWNRKSAHIVSRVANKKGFPYRLPSGKMITLYSDKLYIQGNIVIVPIDAEELVGEIEGIKEDDNPVLLVLHTS